MLAEGPSVKSRVAACDCFEVGSVVRISPARRMPVMRSRKPLHTASTQRSDSSTSYGYVVVSEGVNSWVRKKRPRKVKAWVKCHSGIRPRRCVHTRVGSV